MLSGSLETAVALRTELGRRLGGNANRVLLRILAARNQEPVELTGADIRDRGIALARQYSRAPEGGVSLLLMPHSVELFLLHFGLILTGRLPAILAWPTNRIDPEKYQRNLLHQLRNLPAAELLTLPKLAANLGPGLPYRTVGAAIGGAEEFEKSFAVDLAIDEKPPAVEAGQSPGDAVFLQFSGGTTGAQKCVVVTARMLERQMERLAEYLRFGPEDGVVSWLPLYHDMGLIACLWFPLWQGAQSMQFSASDWLLEPDLLFRLGERYGATHCWLPNFAFSYMAAQKERMRGPYTLGGMRAFVNCSEPVRLRSFGAFTDAFGEWGVRREQLQASYAMAENVFAVTQTPVDSAPALYPRKAVRRETGNGTGNENGDGHAFDLVEDVYVSSGRLLEGMELRIRTPDGKEAGEGVPGGIEIRTESLFGGYWGNDGFRTHALSAQGWYSTGDFGFVSEGELYVIGRTKDIVIVGGQNVFPEDVETIVNAAPGIYPGRVVAFGVADEEQGTESLAVVAELRGEWDEGAAKRSEREIKALVLSAIGIAPRFVRVTPERWIVKSTAGKISRSETRARFLSERQRGNTSRTEVPVNG
ncbi:MAG: AMP-binding protein [Bryobacteraceae bacterium]